MCDLSDPRILEAYTEIEQFEDTNWLILGYNDTRDVISLYYKGTGGLSEFREHLGDEVLYGFVRVDDRFILITWVSEQVSGVRRARALVHSRSVAGLLKSHHAQLTASSLNDLSDANIRTRLKLGESRPSSLTERKRSSLSAGTRRQSSGDVFVEASEELPPPSPPAMTNDEMKRVEEEKRAALIAAEEEKKKKEAAAAEEEKKKKAEQEAAERKRREIEEKQRIERVRQEEEEKKKRIEQQKREEQKRQEQKRQQQEEEEEKKRALQNKMLEAEKNKDVMLVGFASVQPYGSPFWRRRYLVVRGKTLAIYRDELDKSPISVIDLKTVTRLSPIDPEKETFLPNAFVIGTQQNGSYQVSADNKADCNTIMTALDTAIKSK